MNKEWLNPFEWFKKDDYITEALKAFERKNDKKAETTAGEGIENFIDGYGVTGIHTFNSFFNTYINQTIHTERCKIEEYRTISEMPEIADVIEDAVNESTQPFLTTGNILELHILDEKLQKNKNVINILTKEFNELFFKKIDIETEIDDLFRTYLIDGRVYFEKIINEADIKSGIQKIKKLPTESMDFQYDFKTGKILWYYQQLVPHATVPHSKEEALNNNQFVVFNTEQISYINTANYGETLKNIKGFLDKARQPYNQLKLLETSLIIYRLVRAPERFVFKIDVGNMPRDKAMKYVEKIKSQYTKKVNYNPNTGQLENSPDILSTLENFFIPQGENRGSSIETIGGSNIGFTEMHDIYYFAKKLYRSLKYPLSRINQQNEGQDSNVLFNNDSNIVRDEIKWSKYLHKQQRKFCNEFINLFLLHLEFKGLKKQYGLDRGKIDIKMVPPNNYEDRMLQSIRQTQFDNYSHLANNLEFSKSFLMRKYLNFNDEDMKANKHGFDEDKKMIPKQDDGSGGAWGGDAQQPEEPKDEPEEPKDDTQPKKQSTDKKKVPFGGGEENGW